VVQADAPVISVFLLVLFEIYEEVGVGNGVRTRDFRSHSPTSVGPNDALGLWGGDGGGQVRQSGRETR
jgi:hypothetical protein